MSVKAITANKIDDLFHEKARDILSVYFTAGYPTLNSVPFILETLQDCGVDMVEIGIPFSDPIADGETIQQSSQTALENGMTLAHLFDQLKDIRKSINIPIILMGYLNPVYQYGIEAFCRSANEVGIDGLIIPDMPIFELEKTYHNLFQDHGLKNILLITPQSNSERIKKLNQLSTGFNYLVSSASTTGKTGGIGEEQKSYFTRISNMDLNNPALVGFGISSARDFNIACQYANGAIIGSALIKAMMKPGSLEKNIRTFIYSIRQ
jgi:tryptophan synthase alpha chain